MTNAELPQERVDDVRQSFGRQGLMRTLEAEIGTVSAGMVTITAPISGAVTQQHGLLHGR